MEKEKRGDCVKIFIYPGSFDPFTKGHEDIARRAAKLCDKLIVAVLWNKNKQSSFSVEERMEMISLCLKDLKNVEVLSSDKLLAEFMKEQKAKAIVRGLRSESDFRYELEIATTNKLLYADYETILFPSRSDMFFTSSSVVKEIASFGGSIVEMVPEAILDKVEKRFSKRK